MRAGPFAVASLIWASVWIDAARADSLPTVPIGLPEETLLALTDPTLRPHLDRVGVAYSDYLLALFPELGEGGKWLLLSEAEAAARLGRVIAAEDAALAAEIWEGGRHRAEWLAETLDEAEAGLGLDAAMDRAELAVAIERQLAANAFVFGDYFPGTDVAAVVGASQSARQLAIGWALRLADVLRADGEVAAAERLAGKALFWAQTLSQGAAARAAVRPMRAAEGPLAALEALSVIMRKTRFILRYLDEYQLSNAQFAVTDAALAEAMQTVDASLREMQDSGLDMAAAILPRPLPLEELRARLAPDEALILVLPSDLQFTVFAVSHDAFVWYATEAFTLDIDKQVETLLGGIRAWSARSAAPLAELSETPAEGMAATAHWLYRQMLAPARAATAGKARLLIGATGTAAHFPWQLLVTEPPSAGARYEDLAWLVREHALVVVPTAEALSVEGTDNGKGGGQAPGADLRYLGFGAPDYAAGRGTWVEKSWGAPVVGLAPLPEAAEEVREVAALYGAARARVLTGAEASEPALEALSASGELAGYDVVHFATHGLIYGDHPDVGEGLIALTPGPEKRQVTELTLETVWMAQPDGALTESEIRELWLDAALVILSACKTASGQATDRDGVEGLAAAFLHAGARRVMASHWPVNSRAAVDIVTAMMAADPGLQDPATALQGAMLGLIRQGGRKADPSYWAPFSIVGAP